eukprot:6097756-Lingulodinium_polyedra.AAC.1
MHDMSMRDIGSDSGNSECVSAYKYMARECQCWIHVGINAMSTVLMIDPPEARTPMPQALHLNRSPQHTNW